MTEYTIEEIGEKVAEMLLAGETDELRRLRNQYEAADTTVERSTTGFFVHFDVPDTIEPIETEERTILRGVYATLDSLQHGMDFMLFVDDGKLSMLEGYTHQEELPADMETLHGVQLEYSEDEQSKDQE